VRGMIRRPPKHAVAVALAGSLGGVLVWAVVRAESIMPPAPSPPADAASLLPHDLSPWSMFMNADIVVKTVIVGLAFASMATWTLWVAKGLEILFAKRRANAAIRILEEASRLDEARLALQQPGARRDPVLAMIEAAPLEMKRSANLSSDGVKERLALTLSRIEARAGRDMARGAGLLATIGSTAPFVGLFGAVWGIMNSFIGISRSHTTNLAVVAPGIAEALLATAIGLVAAIPAVIVYNVFARSVAGYRALLADASASVLHHASRDLERDESFRGGEAVSSRPSASLKIAAAARAAE
jgi:biopolymer transport protein ExbB